MNLWHAAVRKSMEERRPIVSKLVRWKPTDIRRLATDRVPMDFPDSSNPVHHALRRTAALSNFIFNLIPHCDGITYGPQLAANNLIGQLSRSPAANLNKNQKKCECCCSTCWNLWKFWGYAIRTSDSICSIDARLRVWDDNDFIPSFSSICMCTKKKKIGVQAVAGQTGQSSYHTRRKSASAKIVFLFQLLMISLSLTINLVALACSLAHFSLLYVLSTCICISFVTMYRKSNMSTPIYKFVGRLPYMKTFE